MTKKADWRVEDLEDQVAALSQQIAELRQQLLELTPHDDTSSPESVRYHIKFHRSQQEKKRKKTG